MPAAPVLTVRRNELVGIELYLIFQNDIEDYFGLYVRGIRVRRMFRLLLPQCRGHNVSFDLLGKVQAP